MDLSRDVCDAILRGLVLRQQAATLLPVTSASAGPGASTTNCADDGDALTAVIAATARRAMAKDCLAGVTVAVVCDGRTVLLKGYGYDIIERRRPVDPSLTLFHIGSVTKLFARVISRDD